MIPFQPSAVIFINTDLTDQVKAVFSTQLFLTEIIDAATFDARVVADPNYVKSVHYNDQRIMVLRNLQDHTNRDLADIVLFAKTGLVSVLSNKFGPPNITLPISRVYLNALIKLQTPAHPQKENPPDYDDGFVGQPDNDDFDPNHLDPERNVEPV